MVGFNNNIVYSPLSDTYRRHGTYGALSLNNVQPPSKVLCMKGSDPVNEVAMYQG